MSESDTIITLNYLNPFCGLELSEDTASSYDEETLRAWQELVDQGEIGQCSAVSTLGDIFPTATFAVIPIPTAHSTEDSHEHGKNLGDAKKEFSQIFKALTKDLDKAVKIRLAQEAVDEIVAKMAVAMEAKDFEKIISLSDERATALDKLEKAKKGKPSNGNGDRSNPLPDFEGSNAVLRGKEDSESRILAIRGDAIPNYEKRGLSGNWQAFKADNGHYAWCGTLGKHTSWSGLNAAISKEILENGGKHNSIGTGGLREISATNLETIRTTMLTNLPPIKE